MSLLPPAPVRVLLPATAVMLLATLLAPPPGAAAVSAPASGPEHIQLGDDSGSGVLRAEVPLGAALQRTRAGGDVRRTTTVSTSTFRMLALTWQGRARTPDLAVRTRSADGWQAWQHADPLTDLPDAGEGRAVRARGTQPLWVAESDAVQVRVRGEQPTELALVLLNPEPRPSDAGAGPTGRSGGVSRRAARPSAAPRPPLLGRSQWGADESWRTSAPRYNGALQQVHVHHTATSNSYTRAEVPAIIRGMYSYHTRSLGWSDLGYNFLIDKFGRTWVGRAGGPNRHVRGAHTLGFNHTSVGVALIGTHEHGAPRPRATTSLVRVAAWKLDRVGRRPTGTVRVRSQGSDLYPEGRKVRLPVVDGHRHTNQTACPGGDLHELLPVIRRRSQKRADSFGR